MKTFKYIIFFILSILSIPFAFIGFILEFMWQGFEDGRDLHDKFYNWITK